MNRLVRMLIMFAPMIFRQVQKWQRGRERSAQSNPIPPARRNENPSNPERRANEPKAAPRQPKDSELV